MSEASRALAAIVVEHRASGHQGGAGCPAGPAAFRVHRPPGFERSRSGGERCPVRREMISDGLHRRTSHPLVNTRSLTNQADALAVLTARAGRRITASDVGWDLHRPRNRHHHLDTPGDARRRPEAPPGGSAPRNQPGRHHGPPKPAHAHQSGSHRARSHTPARPEAEASAAPAATRLNEKLVRSIESAVRDLREMDDSTGSASGDLTWGLGIWQSTSRVVSTGCSSTHANTLRLSASTTRGFGWPARPEHH
ncbi:hypothetical protein EDD95_4985 [Streptomyces sp. CEV 2-1]|nr:hypothetical protein EDD95_4985 [Streptomyces sp. CEV 2-1]